MNNVLDMSDVVLAPEVNKKEKDKLKNYIPDPFRVEAIRKRLVKVRMKLLIQMPFWGTLAARLYLQDASGWCSTAATDGRAFYYNVDFIDSLTDAELEFLFGHEILHCAFNHFLRRDTRDPQLWNAAADYAINADLKEAKVGAMPKIGLFEQKYAGWYAEKIYDDLYKNADKMKIPQPMDEHLDLAGSSDGDGEGGGDEEGNGKKGGYKQGDEHNKPNISEGAGQKISDEMRNAVIQAAAEEDKKGNGAGNLPAGLRRLVKSWTKSELDWRQFLEQRVQSTLKDDWSWMRPSRRGGLPGGIIMPGMTLMETIKVHVAIDTSGSMTEQMLKDLMGEVAGIMEQFGEFEVHVWCFDAHVIPQSYKIFTEQNLDEIYQYKLMGGGGTLFESNWAWMREQEIEPLTFLLFTDGYPCDSWGDPNYCDTIFLVHGNDSIVADHGLTLHYKKKGEKG